MDEQKMIHRANQVAAFFEAYPRERAVQGIEEHFRKFWEQRIRIQLVAYTGDDLHPLVQEAVRRLGQDTPA